MRNNYGNMLPVNRTVTLGLLTQSTLLLEISMVEIVGSEGRGASQVRRELLTTVAGSEVTIEEGNAGNLHLKKN